MLSGVRKETHAELLVLVLFAVDRGGPHGGGVARFERRLNLVRGGSELECWGSMGENENVLILKSLGKLTDGSRNIYNCLEAGGFLCIRGLQRPLASCLVAGWNAVCRSGSPPEISKG